MMIDNKTAAFLGTDVDRLHCRLTVTNVSAFSGGWCVFLDGEGRGAIVLVSIPVLGHGPDLAERRFRLRLTVAEAQAMFARCVEHDLASVQIDPPRQAPGSPAQGPTYTRRPDEPWVSLTLRNAAHKHLSLGKPLGLAVPALDAVVRAAYHLTQATKQQEPQYTGPWRSSWTLWKEIDAEL